MGQRTEQQHKEQQRKSTSPHPTHAELHSHTISPGSGPNMVSTLQHYHAKLQWVSRKRSWWELGGKREQVMTTDPNTFCTCTEQLRDEQTNVSVVILIWDVD